MEVGPFLSLAPLPKGPGDRIQEGWQDRPGSVLALLFFEEVPIMESIHPGLRTTN